MENIFTDLFYSKFTMEITKLLKDFEPTITDSGKHTHKRTLTHTISTYLLWKSA